jgi:hypothetical protein
MLVKLLPLVCLLQPTCFDVDLNRRGNQTWRCPRGTLFNITSIMTSPPSDAACCTSQVSCRLGLRALRSAACCQCPEVIM